MLLSVRALMFYRGPHIFFCGALKGCERQRPPATGAEGERRFGGKRCCWTFALVFIVTALNSFVPEGINSTPFSFRRDSSCLTSSSFGIAFSDRKVMLSTSEVVSLLTFLPVSCEYTLRHWHRDAFSKRIALISECGILLVIT